MLQLKEIKKSYKTDSFAQVALDNINLNFRKSEFVAILGTSGSGKTTCLNILGGLDRYDDGDLIINQKSTKDFTDRDWDAYRNNSIGFIFQNYNLIPHLNLIDNVEMGMTLSGLSFKEKRSKTYTVLERVGLKDHMYKKPTELSGGQMQRVAIARALANDPDIILADEPTGALDTKTSKQIMELITEIARDKLVIMVTHNPVLAKEYADRVIHFQDGHVTYDSNPYPKEPDVVLTDTPKNNLSTRTDEQLIGVIQKVIDNQADQLLVRITKYPNLPIQPNDRMIHYQFGSVRSVQGINQNLEDAHSDSKYKLTHTSMSFLTALKLSRKNILTKIWRTALIAFASSIGIIGIALILSLSNGFQYQIDQFQINALSEFPIMIGQAEMNLIGLGPLRTHEEDDPLVNMRFADTVGIYVINSSEESRVHRNRFTDKFLDHLNELNPEYLTSIGFKRLLGMNLLRRVDEGEFVRVMLGVEDAAIADLASGLAGARLSSFPENSGDDASFLEQNFDLVAGVFPESETDLVLIIDIYNRLDDIVLESLGFAVDELERLDFDDVIGTEFRLITNNDFYIQTEQGNFLPGTDFEEMYDSDDSITLTISAVLRRPDDMTVSMLGRGIAYSDALAQRVIEIEMDSEIVAAQRDANYNVITFEPVNNLEREALVATFGGDETPMMIFLYPSSFEGKDAIISHLQYFNTNQIDEGYRIAYTDLASTMTDLTRGIMDGVTMTLIAFSAFSLVVSLIMIAIITYISVIERTKEIGVLRALGARRKDITRVFNAETFIIGLCSGILAITITYGLTIPINQIVESATELVNVANLNPVHAFILIIVSLVLTLLGGMIPAKMAAKKDPVVALRTE